MVIFNTEEMKSIRYILGLLFVLLIQSCVKEEIFVDNDNISIVASANLNTRTTYSSENGATYVSWKKGDAIGLFTKDFNNLKYLADQDGAETTFSGSKLDVAEGDTVYAYYPFVIGSNTFVPLPKTYSQSQSNGLSAYDCMYAVGVVKNRRVELKFQHLFAVLRIKIPAQMLYEQWYGRIDCHSTEPCSVNGGVYDIATNSYDKPGANYIHCTYNRNSLKNVDSVTFHLAVLPQSENAVLEFKEYKGDFSNQALNTLFEFRAPKGGFKAGYVYNLNLNKERIESRKIEDIKALKAFYDATDGPNWKKTTNWFTDKPLYEWYGLGKTDFFDYATIISLWDNNLKGNLPVEFTYFMDNIKTIEIQWNQLSGKIPQEVMQHPRWNEVGWNVIQQQTELGYGFDLSEGSNLYEKNVELEYLNGETIMSHDLFKKNKISLVCPDHAVSINTIGTKRTNLLLSYRNKGFEIIVVHGDEKLEDAVSNAELYPIKDGVTRIYGRFNKFQYSNIADIHSYCRSFVLIDENASVIDYFYEKNGATDIIEINDKKLEKILYDRLGEPEEHEEYTGYNYTSTDYSMDGSVVTLQKATNGKGIDLVFMGDGYVDKDMAAGGKYERHMKESMEYFFAVEPYKSYRSRFNVYAVKVVSDNELFVKGGKQKINYNNEVCFEYAKKIQGVDMDNVTIVNVVNNPSDMIAQGYTNMYESGASVAHIQVGGPSNIIVHEAGGHGFAKLLDEYISAYEQVSPENMASFQNWLKTEYHNKGWGVNVDATSDPESIIWAHFLKDSRYTKEVGIYKGAWNWPDHLWRPSDNSVMRNDYTRFNAPSREAIYKRIMKLSEGDDWEYSYDKFVIYDAINRNKRSSNVSSYTNDTREHINHQPPTIIKGSWRDADK